MAKSRGKDAKCDKKAMVDKVKGPLKSKGAKDKQGADKGKPNGKMVEEKTPRASKWDTKKKSPEKPAQEKFWGEPESAKLPKPHKI